MSLRVSEGRRRQRGFSLIELLIVITIIMIILTFAIPKYRASQMNAKETGAVLALKTIYTVQVQYESQFGQFATSLAQLGPPASSNGTEGPQAAGLISGNLASGSTGGYNYTITQTPTGYAVSAVPQVFGSTGRRTFYSDQTGVIRENWGREPATTNSPEVK